MEDDRSKCNQGNDYEESSSRQRTNHGFAYFLAVAALLLHMEVLRRSERNETIAEFNQPSFC